MKKLRKLCNLLAKNCADVAGSSFSVGGALLVVFAWALAGPFMGFSETWQLLINTLTTIITFLLALSIQYTQNRDTRSLHLKLNKLLEKSDSLKESLDQIEEELGEDD